MAVGDGVADDSAINLYSAPPGTYRQRESTDPGGIYKVQVYTLLALPIVNRCSLSEIFSSSTACFINHGNCSVICVTVCQYKKLIRR